MSLPGPQDINIYDSLDERSACKHFLGKNLEEAEALFRENSLYYQEHLMFMGAPAFRFYVTAAISYIQSEAATGDSDIISCFAGLLEHRLEFEARELIAVGPQLASVCRYILDHYDRFDLASEHYGDLRPRLLSLEQSFLRKVHA